MLKKFLDAQDIERIVSRISSEIMERLKDPSQVIVIGLIKRGEFLAKRIGEQLEDLGNVTVDKSAIDITFYRDDVKLKAYKYVLKDEISFDITDKDVLIVDDVIHTGRTIRAAVDALMDTGRPRSIQLAVLVDRGGRELPIQPDYFGIKMPAGFDNEVDVKVVELDGVDEVLISWK